LEHLFVNWPEAAAQIAAARHVLLLSDYDGTLTPIVAKPELAHLAPSTRTLLQAVVQHERFTVGVVSGRALTDVRALVDLPDIIYVGNHGLEIEGPGLSFVHPQAESFQPLLDQMYRELQQALSAIKGVLVEHKGLTLSVHYRLVAEEQVAQVSSAFERLVRLPQFRDKLMTSHGKRVCEVRPAVEWDKGRSVSFLLDNPTRWGGTPGPLAIYLGDDVTDESGFEAVQQRDGVAVFVGEAASATSAQHYLVSSQEVAELLRRLVDNP
jgi:trehalose-phosphatase